MDYLRKGRILTEYRHIATSNYKTLNCRTAGGHQTCISQAWLRSRESIAAHFLRQKASRRMRHPREIAISALGAVTLAPAFVSLLQLCLHFPNGLGKAGGRSKREHRPLTPLSEVYD